ncbi:MAG: CBS domain-containing membrane protein [Colwellia sp.]|jgi:CBS domain-containing membrane protein|tara:strand:+ start:21810 stop:22805 length:996 start_codon:yes stop_codon:yes gene_type:complete
MMKNTFIKEFSLYLGIPTSITPAKDIALAALTSLIATLAVLYFSQFFLNYMNITEHIAYNTYVIISIAATSVLVFSVPHGALSQPWPVVAGHIFSALVGVLCWKFLGNNVLLAAAVSVSLSVFIMSYFRCIHPPGGATALGAVLGGDAIHDLGFSYILVPTLLNCVIILIAAIILNYPFRWRRYPSHVYFKHHGEGKVSPGDRENEITIEDFMKSVNEHGSFIDITDEGWIEIFENAKRHAELDIEHPTQIESGLAYSNGKIGKKWEIRKISLIGNKNIVKFIILTGSNAGLYGNCTIKEFVNWAKFEVAQNRHHVWIRTNESIPVPLEGA